MAPSLGCYRRSFGSGGYINCGESVLWIMEAEDENHPRVSVLGIFRVYWGK